MKYRIADISMELPEALIPRHFAEALRPFAVAEEGQARDEGPEVAREAIAQARGASSEVAREAATRARGACPEVAPSLTLHSATGLRRADGWAELHRFDFADAGADCCFGRDAEGFLLEMVPRNGSRTIRFRLGGSRERALCDYTPEQHPGLFRFGVWMLFNLAALAHATLSLHASAILYQGYSVLFLGESGTGKSTHTRLWRQYIPGATLLNDDSPLVRLAAGQILAAGSPWSGKLPCYRNEIYPIAAIVRLSQAPENRIRRLRPLEAFGALFPSAPPAFIRDTGLREEICRLLTTLVEQLPVYHLACRPDVDAARIACKVLFGETSPVPAKGPTQETASGDVTGPMDETTPANSLRTSHFAEKNLF